MTVTPLTMEDVSRDIMMVQIPKWIKDVETMILRKTFLYRRLTQGGRIVKEKGGIELIWPLKIRLPAVEGFANHQGMSFEPTSKEIECRLGYRNLRAGDSMSMIDEIANQGPQALRKLINDKAKDLRAAMTTAMESMVYLNGNLPANAMTPHGLETGLVAGNVTANDRIAQPNTVYANQSTVLGANGGFWSATLGTPNNIALANDWPDGHGDTEYDCNSPKLINTRTLAWGTTSTAHGRNLYRAISQGMVWLTVTGGDGGTPDLCPTDSHSFQRLREDQEAKLRLDAPQPSGVDVGMPGYEGSVNLDGLTIYPDFWCPATTSYLIRTDQIELRSRIESKDLFVSKGPIEVPQMTFSKIWAIFASLNFRFSSMKHFGKVAPLSP